MILQPIDTPISPALYLTFAAISKLFAALTTYPYQVAKTFKERLLKLC